MATHLTPELLWRIPRVGRPVAAGATLVVPVTTYDLEQNEGTTRLWQIDGATPRPLTGESASATAPEAPCS